ncbi:protein kinase [Nocardia sp. NPDC051750]|uniref:protein kinase domain-containing protein n=1 Tax=Nocardia sp. NPDC051750 TaxID=3364325 RepID=UPI003792C72C
MPAPQHSRNGADAISEQTEPEAGRRFRRAILPRAADMSAFPHGTRHEHVLLGDFGIAKAVAESTSLTETSALVTTVRYAAPEVLSGFPAGPAADQHSLGCTLFHLLTGRPPFDADNG